MATWKVELDSLFCPMYLCLAQERFQIIRRWIKGKIDYVSVERLAGVTSNIDVMSSLDRNACPVQIVFDNRKVVRPPIVIGY